MAAPTAPFSLTTDIAPFHQMLLKSGTDFVDGSNGTRPSNTEVTSFIVLVDSQVTSRFRLAGFKIPFTELSGETWPVDQTDFLRWMSIMGTSALISGPAIANPGSRGRTQNPYQVQFSGFLDQIFDMRNRIAMPFRAQYYSETPAEQSVGTSSLPNTDFLAGKYDPSLHYNLYDLTDKVHSIQQIMRDLDLDWNYAYGLNDLNQGLPRYVDEV